MQSLQDVNMFSLLSLPSVTHQQSVCEHAQDCQILKITYFFNQIQGY